MADQIVALVVVALASIAVGTGIPLAYRLLSALVDLVASRTAVWATSRSGGRPR